VATGIEVTSQRERLLWVFRGKKPDRAPWVADLYYWQSGQEALGTLPERYRGSDGMTRLHEETGAGRIFYIRPGVVQVKRDEALFRYEERWDGTYVKQIWHTPEGSLTGVRKYAGGGTSLAPIEWPVKEIEDVPAMCAWLESARYSESFDAFYRAEDEWGEQGYPFITTLPTPLAAFLVHWAGVENFTYMAMDHPGEIEKAFRRLREAQDEYFAILANAPGEIIEIGDNLSATVQASYFRRYSLEYYQDRAAQLHATGKKVGVHIDGTLRGLLEQLPEAGLDFGEAVTPAPVGDMGFEEIRRAVGPEFIVIGGIPGPMFAAPFAWPSLRDHVYRAIRVLGHDGRFVLGVGDQVPPDADLESVRKVSDLVNEFVI